MQIQTLKEALQNWTDMDDASFKLAVCLGLMSPDGFGRAKYVFWTNHDIGIMLFQMLEKLCDQTILEKRDEPAQQYRWNAAFKGSWQ